MTNVIPKKIILSPETLGRCVAAIRRENNILPHENRPIKTIVNLFYRSSGFDPRANKALSKATVTKILNGQSVDELSVREFLFFLKLIPQTDPEGIDEFLREPLSKTPSTVSPYPLLREKLNFQGNKISLSREASRTIQQCIKDLGLSPEIIGEQCNLTHTSIHDTLARCKLWRKEPFQKILKAFLDQGVITLPEGETLDNLLSTDQEPPHTLTKGDIDFKENKVCLSEKGRNGIKDVIKRGGFNKEKIVGSISIGQNTFYKALGGEYLTLKTLEKVLQGLIDEGVIAPLPEGQTLKQLLYPEAESSYTTTDTVVSTAQNCAAVAGGGGDSSTHSSALTFPPPAHIANNNGR